MVIPPTGEVFEGLLTIDPFIKILSTPEKVYLLTAVASAADSW